MVSLNFMEISLSPETFVTITTDSLNTRTAPCDLAPEEFRAIGHSLVDSIADFLRGLPAAPTATSLMPDSLRSVLGQRAMPEDGTDIAPV